MADQEEMVAICPGGKVYHRTWRYARWLGDRDRRFPLCGGISYYLIMPITKVGNRRLCKRCARVKESDE